MYTTYVPQQPVYQQPQFNYQQPVYQQPTYAPQPQQPVYQQPQFNYQQPVYQQPTYAPQPQQPNYSKMSPEDVSKIECVRNTIKQLMLRDIRRYPKEDIFKAYNKIFENIFGIKKFASGVLSNNIGVIQATLAHIGGPNLIFYMLTVDQGNYVNALHILFDGYMAEKELEFEKKKRRKNGRSYIIIDKKMRKIEKECKIIFERIYDQFGLSPTGKSYDNIIHNMKKWRKNLNDYSMGGDSISLDILNPVKTDDIFNTTPISNPYYNNRINMPSIFDGDEMDDQPLQPVYQQPQFNYQQPVYQQPTYAPQPPVYQQPVYAPQPPYSNTSLTDDKDEDDTIIKALSELTESMDNVNTRLQNLEQGSPRIIKKNIKIEEDEDEDDELENREENKDDSPIRPFSNENIKPFSFDNDDDEDDDDEDEVEVVTKEEFDDTMKAIEDNMNKIINQVKEGLSEGVTELVNSLKHDMNNEMIRVDNNMKAIETSYHKDLNGVIKAINTLHQEMKKIRESVTNTTKSDTSKSLSSNSGDSSKVNKSTTPSPNLEMGNFVKEKIVEKELPPK